MTPTMQLVRPSRQKAEEAAKAEQPARPSEPPRVVVKLTEDEHTALKVYAAKRRASISDVVRELLQRAGCFEQD